MQDGNEAVFDVDSGAVFDVDSEVVEAHDAVPQPDPAAHQVRAELLEHFVVPVDPVRESADQARVELSKCISSFFPSARSLRQIAPIELLHFSFDQ